jgi:hypothetical protein
MRAFTLTIVPVNAILFMHLSSTSVLVWYLGKRGSVMGYASCNVLEHRAAPSVDLDSMTGDGQLIVQ